jgi:hypothetical protein
MFEPVALKHDANLYVYVTDKKLYDDISLEWYKTSGKFDRNSVGRMMIHDKYRGELVRASIDNSWIFLPTRNPLNAIVEGMVGHIMLVCCEDSVKSIGVVVKNVECPGDFLCCERLLMVHVLSTSNTPLDFPFEFKQDEYLPERVMKLSSDVADKIDLGVENLSLVHEYERHILHAHSYAKFVDGLMQFETPVKSLEIERKKRLLALRYHLEQKRTIHFPPVRQLKYSWKTIVRLHHKYSEK